MCCSPWDHKESDTTELLNNNNKSLKTLYYLSQKYWHHPLPLISFCNLFSVQKLLLLAPPLKYVWNLTTSCELHYWNHFPNNVISHLSHCNSLLTDFSPPLLPLNTLVSSKQSEEYGRPLNIGVTGAHPPLSWGCITWSGPSVSTVLYIWIPPTEYHVVLSNLLLKEIHI